jgi:hypothetical protein
VPGRTRRAIGHRLIRPWIEADRKCADRPVA